MSILIRTSKISTFLLIMGFINPFVLKADVDSKDVNYTNKFLEINVISSNLSLTKGSKFYVPAIEQKIDLLNNNAATLNTSLKDIVKNFSALQVSGGPRRAAQSFTMRGFDKSGIVVLIDDLPVSFLSQHINFLPISLMPMSSIDVIRGPFSSIYGSNALGGVVSLTTVDPSDLISKDKNKGINISTSYASAKKNFNLIGTAYNSGNTSDFLGSINYMNSKNTITGKNNKVKVPELDEQISGMLKARYFINKQILSFAYYFNLDDVTIPANPEQNDTSSSRIRNIDHSIKLQNHTLRASHELNNEDSKSYFPSMKTLMYLNYAKHDETPKADFPAPPGSKPFYKKGDNLGKTNYSLGGFHKESLNYVFDNNIWTSLVYGVDYKFQDQQRNSNDPRGLIANARAHNLGVFLQDELFLSNYITLLGAMRYDYFDIEHKGIYEKIPNSDVQPQKSKVYNQISPKTSLTIKPFEYMMLYTSYGRAFKTPNLNEMHSAGLHFQAGNISNVLIPNPNLRPTTSDTVEVGYGFNFNDILGYDSTLNIKNAFYYTSAKDFITLHVTRSTSQYINVEKVKMHGIDLVFNYENNLHKASISYNYTKALDVNKNIGLLNISDHTFKHNYEFTLPTKTKWFLGYNLLAQSSFDVYQEDKNKMSFKHIKMPGFATIDLYAGIKANNYRLSIGIDNILDKFYYDTFAGLPAAGRSYKVMLTIKY